MKMKMAFAGAAVAALALAGCSSDSDDDAEASPSPSVEDSMDEAGTIVDIAAGSEDFDTLVTAVQAADLVDTLNGEGPFTVFAPTDAAFEAVDEETLNKLLDPANKDALISVLTYHVIGDEVTSDEVAPGDVATLDDGKTVTITVDDEGNVMVNDAMVTDVDLMASNGVIHVIDGVLLPPDFDPTTLQ